MKAVFTFSVVSFSNKINHCFSSDNNILDQTAFSRTVAMYKKNISLLLPYDSSIYLVRCFFLYVS